ncbi:MAG: hypothetical protein DHS20C18_31180 [Saprospiraceae bacterium]|nr:MAG: hypothetical protein DHS20C18_31180 [Saprospiraceae bacterium]
MNNVQHRSVLQYQLDMGLGYGYCKLLDFTSLDPWYGLVIKIYDFKSEKPIQDVKVLQDVEYLLNPLTLGWFPSLNDQCKWKIIGKLSRADDSVCPVYKIEKESSSQNKSSKFATKNWCPIYNFSKKGTSCQYNQLAHLETLQLVTTQSIINRTTMEFLRKSGEKIENYYYEEENKATLEDYHQAIQMPFYSNIPIEYRNKVIPTKELPAIKHIPSVALCLAAALSF